MEGDASEMRYWGRLAKVSITFFIIIILTIIIGVVRGGGVFLDKIKIIFVSRRSWLLPKIHYEHFTQVVFFLFPPSLCISPSFLSLSVITLTYHFSISNTIF